MTILAATLLITDIVLRYTEKIKSFGFERKLFRIKGDTIPAEKFFPENLTMAFINLLCFGTAGMLLELAGLRWFFSLPSSVMAGMFVCFMIQHTLRAAVDRFTEKTIPTGDKAAGVQGFAVGEIDNDGDGYGLIEFEYNSLTFRAPAVSANETAIPMFEKVIILFEEDGVYFVQSIKEVYDIDV
ncbi:MAG: hypothetical protein LBC82_05725 [Oscillospiraceae bacterium]|nr:hypothetical protein [Oscillospiraceae bacterium]